jgi:hypothetical protein
MNGTYTMKGLPPAAVGNTCPGCGIEVRDIRLECPRCGVIPQKLSLKIERERRSEVRTNREKERGSDYWGTWGGIRLALVISWSLSAGSVLLFGGSWWTVPTVATVMMFPIWGIIALGRRVGRR